MGRKTPGVVRTAFWLNLALLLIALILPQAVAYKPGAKTDARIEPTPLAPAMAFAIPMVLIVVIGAGAALRSYVVARAEGRRLSWTAFLPLSLFFVGIAGMMAMILWQVD